MDKQTALERLKARSTIVENGCWLYKYSLFANGYGYITIDGKRIYVHRLSAYIHFDFDLSSKLLICHKPVVCKHRNCWNPDHIYIGTYSDNGLDMCLEGVGNSSKTHCLNGHPLEGRNLITKKRLNGRLKRECRQCHNERRRSLSPST